MQRFCNATTQVVYATRDINSAQMATEPGCRKLVDHELDNEAYRHRALVFRAWSDFVFYLDTLPSDTYARKTIDERCNYGRFRFFSQGIYVS